MKGLFLNQFYEAWNNMRILGIFLAVFGICVAHSGNYTMMELFPYITICVFAVSGIATLRKDAVSQWNKYELTLPLRRRDLVRSKYLNFLFWTFVGLLVSTFVVGITSIIHGNMFYNGLRDCLSLFSLGIGLAVMAGALFFPLAIVCGADKSEILLTISIFSSILLAVVIINAINIFDWHYAIGLGVFNLLYAFLYAASYCGSNMLYRRKAL